MSYQAIARKYRPQTFDEVIGQQTIVRTLKNAIEKDKVTHAYIFSGTRGVGKTTTARILAKALNCEKGPTTTPCGKCPACTEIAAAAAVDVIEIDAASNRGIDEIRELRETVRYLPARDRFKVFIIDEVHMLTNEAFNALLKTLEEPPARVVFVLATTEPHKIPPTIHSRCQSFHFRTVSFQEILAHLREVAKSEGVAIDDPALAILARGAEGSIRDGLSLLDQVIAYSGKSVSTETVRQLLGVVGQELLDRLIDAIRGQDSRQALRLVDELVSSGHNLQHFCREALRHVRNLLLARIGGQAAEIIEAVGDEVKRLETTAADFAEEDLLRYFHVLLRTEQQLRYAPQPRLHLELGLLKMVQAARLAPLEEVLGGLSGGTADIVASPSTAGVRSVSGGQSPGVSPSDGPRQALPQPEAAEGAPLSSDRVEAIKSAVYDQSKFLGSLVDNITGWNHEDGRLHLHFAPENRMLIEMLGADQRAQLEAIIAQVLGRPIRVELRAGSDPPAPPPQLAEKNESAQKVPLTHPTVEALVKTFGGRIRPASELRGRSKKK